MRVLTNSVFRDDVSYLLVGGLGGLGKAIAQWMVWNGAKNIVFLSRSGLKSQSSQEFVQDLEKDGATVMNHTGNVCDEKQVTEIVEECAVRKRPIRGIIQCAMVLKVSWPTIPNYHVLILQN